MLRAAFYKAKGLPYNYLVRWFERGPYSHVELVFSDGICASSSMMDGGVRFKQIDLNPDNWDFIDLPSFDETSARQWFVKNDPARYDFWGQLKFIFGWVKPASTRFWCSESVALALGIEPHAIGVNPLASVLKQR